MGNAGRLRSRPVAPHLVNRHDRLASPSEASRRCQPITEIAFESRLSRRTTQDAAARRRPLRARLAAAAAQPRGAVLRLPLPADRRPVPAGAGLLARHRAHRPGHGNVTGTIKVGGKIEDIVSADRASRSARPGTSATYFLGADENGRDVAVRLLYGGRNSLEIGAVATLITMVFGDDPAACSPATSAASPTGSSAACST